MRDTPHLSRREWLAAAGAAVGAAALGGRAAAAADGSYGPFKVGLQSYSLRGYKSLETALAKTKELGLTYWESYAAHIPVSTDPAQLSAVKAKLEAAGVTVNGFGVIRFSKDHAANRALFEFGKAMGLAYFSADPDPDAFDSLDKLVDEYKIAVGIHNHGPGHRYDTIEVIEKAIKDHHRLIGVCNDTGHFLRSKVDPVDVVKAFGKRTYGVHLKDVKDAKTFTVLGEGDLRTADLLRALAAIDYDYCLAIEYEEHPENPIDDIRACLAAARKAAAGL